MTLIAKWNYPTTVRFGAGRISELAEACTAAGIKNPLFVTDPVVAKMPMTTAVLKGLKDAGIAHAVFSDVQPNPVAANVEAGIKAVRAGKASCLSARRLAGPYSSPSSTTSAAAVAAISDLRVFNVVIDWR
jgi:alcohol dehydrogenase class IV